MVNGLVFAACFFLKFSSRRKLWPISIFEGPNLGWIGLFRFSIFLHPIFGCPCIVRHCPASSFNFVHYFRMFFLHFYLNLPKFIFFSHENRMWCVSHIFSSIFPHHRILPTFPPHFLAFIWYVFFYLNHKTTTIFFSVILCHCWKKSEKECVFFSLLFPGMFCCNLE